jgi:hypothetical protein
MNHMQSDQPAPIHRQTLDVSANPGRRKILALVIASAFLPSLVQAASSVATGPAGQKFMALSLFATGRSKLDPEIGTKLFAALRDSDASFAGAADSLAADAARFDSAFEVVRILRIRPQRDAGYENIGGPCYRSECDTFARLLPMSRYCARVTQSGREQG